MKEQVGEQERRKRLSETQAMHLAKVYTEKNEGAGVDLRKYEKEIEELAWSMRSLQQARTSRKRSEAADCRASFKYPNCRMLCRALKPKPKSSRIMLKGSLQDYEGVWRRSVPCARPHQN